MTQTTRTAFLLFVLSSFSFAAEVVKITSDPSLVGISLDPNKPYSVHETVCFERKGEDLGCGLITKIFKKGAAVELESSQIALQVGDRLVSRKPASLANSQETLSEPESEMLGKAHLGFTYPDYATISNNYSKLYSYLIGIGAEIPLHPAVSFEPSLFLSPEWVSAISEAVTLRGSLTYLEIPLYIKWKPFYQSVKRISPYFLIGPSYGYLLSAKVSYEGLDTPETDTTQLYNSSRFSINVGVGFETEVSDSLTLGVSLRYLNAIASPTRATSSSTSAKLIQGLVTFGWQYEDDSFD